MNLEQIDAMLADMRARSGRIGDDLLELSQAITYQRLVGEGGWPRVDSPTRPRRGSPRPWRPCATSGNVASSTRASPATVLRNSVSWFLPSQKTLDEIEQLLRGPSIELPPARRGLAAPTARSLSPGELLEDMARSFRLAREAVLAVDAAWDRLLPVLANFEGEAAAIQGLADAPMEPAPAELAEARRKILSLREAVEHDPLAAEARGEEIAPLLKAARARLDDLARDRDRAGAMVAEARQLLDSLEEAHRRARQAHADREAKVQADAPAVFPRPLDDGQVAALGPWLEKLDATVREGKWKPALVGLAKWTTIVRQYLADEEATREANDAR